MILSNLDVAKCCALCGVVRVVTVLQCLITSVSANGVACSAGWSVFGVECAVCRKFELLPLIVSRVSTCLTNFALELTPFNHNYTYWTLPSHLPLQAVVCSLGLLFYCQTRGDTLFQLHLHSHIYEVCCGCCYCS